MPYSAPSGGYVELIFSNPPLVEPPPVEPPPPVVPPPAPIPVQVFPVWRDYTERSRTITGLDVQDMVSHQLHTPQNGYLGSNYGQNTKALLQRPQSDGSADEYLNKLRTDVSVLQILPAGSVNLYGVQTPPDQLTFMIEVAGSMFTIPTNK